MISALDILPRVCKGNGELSGGVVFFIVVFQLILNLVLGWIVLPSHHVIESETSKTFFNEFKIEFDEISHHLVDMNCCIYTASLSGSVNQCYNGFYGCNTANPMCELFESRFIMRKM